MRDAERVLGIDGGGTKTDWVLLKVEAGGAAAVLAHGRKPGANYRLATRGQLQQIFRELPADAARVGAFLAGCSTAEDRRALAAICAEVWPHAQVITGGDRDSGFAAAFGGGDGIAVNAGTGSSVTGRREGQSERAGGWGHILGDAGGGYYVSVQTLRLILRAYDLRRETTALAQEILGALAMNSLDDLVRWAQAADKMEIATLAPLVFGAAKRGDRDVLGVFETGALALAQYTAAVASRLRWPAPPVRLLGSLFDTDEIYADAFRRQLAALLPAAAVEISAHSAAFGAAALAAGHTLAPVAELVAPPAAVSLAQAATEQRNERSAELETMSARAIVELFVTEEICVQEALHGCAEPLTRAIETVAEALAHGGRLFYIGAGTSGRLGVLDASEIPPTFGTAPELVQGIIAGGAGALQRSVEGAEDDAGAGATALQTRGLTGADVVCGITASGRTPFVLGALDFARGRGARTILLTCNPARARDLPAAEIEIDLATGPELLTGSTRLKAGTATKVALNIISTGAMVRLGKVRGNAMIDVAITNEKLRDRAIRILSEAACCSYETAAERLAASGWNLRRALAAASS